MAEYIERTAELILAVNAGARVIENTKRYHGASYCVDIFAEKPKEIAYLKAAEVLRGFDEIPAADVAPVVHGEWEDYHFVKVDCPKSGFPTVKCSVCEIAFCDLINNHHFMYHYCPNCGAKMDGERKDADG